MDYSDPSAPTGREKRRIEAPMRTHGTKEVTAKVWTDLAKHKESESAPLDMEGLPQLMSRRDPSRQDTWANADSCMLSSFRNGNRGHQPQHDILRLLQFPQLLQRPYPCTTTARRRLHCGAHGCLAHASPLHYLHRFPFQSPRVPSSVQNIMTSPLMVALHPVHTPDLASSLALRAPLESLCGWDSRRSPTQPAFPPYLSGITWCDLPFVAQRHPWPRPPDWTQPQLHLLFFSSSRRRCP